MAHLLPLYLGTPSDRGYNSMTQEEARSISEVLSQESRAESSFKRDLKNALRFSFRRKSKKKESQIQEDAQGNGSLP